MKPSAEFIGLQFGFRLYNVTGEHPLRGSGVSVKTLVDNSIVVPDLTGLQIIEELQKINAYLEVKL